VLALRRLEASRRAPPGREFYFCFAMTLVDSSAPAQCRMGAARATSALAPGVPERSVATSQRERDMVSVAEWSRSLARPTPALGSHDQQLGQLDRRDRQVDGDYRRRRRRRLRLGKSVNQSGFRVGGKVRADHE